MTSIKHNNRDLSEEEYLEVQHQHIDKSKVGDNIYIKQENLKEVYQKLFGPSLADYNAKQKRKDRVIEDYYQHVKKSKTLDLQREFIVGIGNKQDWDGLKPEGKKIVGQMLATYVEEFQKRHPNLYIYNAAVHLDEKGHPHAHFNVVPLATGYKNGLAIQPSFKKALQNAGYIEKGRYQLKAFKDGEVKVLEGMLKQLGVKRKLIGTNDIKDMHEYKDMIQQVNQEKEHLLSQIDVERSQRLSESRKLQERINALKNTESVLEGKIEALEDEIEEMEQKALESHDRVLKRLERDFDVIVQEMSAQLPGTSQSEQDIAFVKELGYEGVDDLVLKNQTLSAIVNHYRQVLQEVKTIFHDLNIVNAFKKAKEVWDKIKVFQEPRLDAGVKERLARVKNQVLGRPDPFKRRLEDVIAAAKREQVRQTRKDFESKISKRDHNGPSL
ncbi:plasmid recombination protein [Streptococcus acidominimus]|uniref:Plasmid recombination enzyme n=3 Tax=Streptococcus acidominimus TaxID=1326 RepID=A0A380JLD3_STRAI|nr:plasmid recombination protein [Streptococcus acidominimus]SUN41405.1 Plasmid recombination enzyme [Streptococcus acidominimus]